MYTRMNCKEEKTLNNYIRLDAYWCSDCSFIITTVKEFGVYEPVRMTLQLDIDRESVMGLSVLTGAIATSTTLSEVRKLTYTYLYIVLR